VVDGGRPPGELAAGSAARRTLAHVALAFPEHLALLAVNENQPAPTRYAAERLHELCAPGTHFAYSAAF
jgi:hypothetical protein